jgi:hypothetical protein
VRSRLLLLDEQSPKPSWLPNELRWLSKQIRPLLHLHLGSFLCITAGSLLGLLTPLVLKWLIDQILPHKQAGLLVLSVALLLVGYQGRMALSSLGNYLMLSAAQTTGLSLRMHLLRHLDTLSADYYEDTPVGTVMYPLKEPIDEISYFGIRPPARNFAIVANDVFHSCDHVHAQSSADMGDLAPRPSLPDGSPAFSAKAHGGIRHLARRPARMESIPRRASLFCDSDTTFGSAKAARANGLSAFGSVGPITTKFVQKQRLVHRGQFGGSRPVHVCRDWIRWYEGARGCLKRGKPGGFLQFYNPAL